ncbi:MAG: methyltransferase domain-containing protein [bacterium]|nr:MAG: methyltransferase domain-containing protein [bacterium]
MWVYRFNLGLDIDDLLPEFTRVHLVGCGVCGLRFFEPHLAGTEEFYRRLQGFEWYYLETRPEFARSAAYTSQKVVLEVGSGRGAAVPHLRPREYVGLEMSGEAARRARADGIDVRRQSISQHAVERPGHYDVVCAFQVLEHIPDVQEFIQSCVKCLRPSGTLIFSVPSLDSFIARSPNNALNLPPHHAVWWSERALRFVPECVGVELVDVIHHELEEVHYRWYARIMAEKWLADLIRFRVRPTVDRRSSYRRLSRISGRIARLTERRLRGKRPLPAGHTVTAVYRRKEGN